ncbi:MAG: cytochrome c [Deferrisomatales bacterium]|nr:cytochrome c [Deferrisomatales bacterium]
MKRIGWMAMGVLAAAWLAGCGGSGGGGEDTATITGRLSNPSAARTAAAGGLYYVEAVDESGTTQDVAGAVTAEFRLEVPVGHDYVLVVGDDTGPIGGMRYGAPGRERSEFRVLGDVALGELVVDPASGHVWSSDPSGIVEPDHADHADHDGDGIPNHADDDDDNDGIPDHRGGDDTGVCGDANAANGRAVFEANCAGCHTAAAVGGEDAEEIAEVLAEGEDDMPAMPGFVAHAADIAAYLAGCPAGGGSPEPTDTDGDGVADAVDQCSDTPPGAIVDSGGCTVVTPPGDADNDGVSDAADQCPGTPAGANVDAAGCEITSIPAPPDGAQLFISTCGDCHNGNGLGSGTIRNLTGTSAATLGAKLGGGHQNFSATTFTAAELAAISAAITP